MNLFFARGCIAVCAFCAPILLAGQTWALLPLLLGLFGILYYVSLTRKAAGERG